jgi:hypothetical protein
MAKYSKKAEDKISDVMHEKKVGKLRSSSGKKVTSRKQAVAIAISEARQAGYKVPKKKNASASTRKKTAKKKSASASPRKKTAKKKTAKKRTAK